MSENSAFTEIETNNYDNRHQ